jgi:hypothetical protein
MFRFYFLDGTQTNGPRWRPAVEHARAMQLEHGPVTRITYATAQKHVVDVRLPVVNHCLHRALNVPSMLLQHVHVFRHADGELQYVDQAGKITRRRRPGPALFEQAPPWPDHEPIGQPPQHPE